MFPATRYLVRVRVNGATPLIKNSIRRGNVQRKHVLKVHVFSPGFSVTGARIMSDKGTGSYNNTYDGTRVVAIEWVLCAVSRVATVGRRFRKTRQKGIIIIIIVIIIIVACVSRRSSRSDGRRTHRQVAAAYTCNV